jgi:hypothetical protein
VDEIHELLVAEEAVEKLGARSISVEELSSSSTIAT